MDMVTPVQKEILLKEAQNKARSLALSV
jgi:hypothetical protein